MIPGFNGVTTFVKNSISITDSCFAFSKMDKIPTLHWRDLDNRNRQRIRIWDKPCVNVVDQNGEILYVGHSMNGFGNIHFLQFCAMNFRIWDRLPLGIKASQ